ncbi:MAG: uroporphyrinogen decarboxylase family protein [Thermoleophilia bacterium]
MVPSDPFARILDTLRPDRLTWRERIAALGKPGARPDRVPVYPRVGGFATFACGWSVADCYRDAHRSFAAQLRVRDLFGHDSGPGYGYASMGGWELGGDIRWPEGEFAQAPEVSRYPVRSEDDLDRLAVPADVLSAGAVPIMAEFSRLEDRHFSAVGLQLGGPVSRALTVAPPEMVLRWMLKRPALAHHLFRVITDFLLEVAAAWARLFPGRGLSVFEDAPGEANALISPRMFREFSLPYLHEIHERAFALGFDSFSTHICGDHTANLESWAELDFARPGKVGAVSFGLEVPIDRAIEVLGHKAILIGNVDPARLRRGTPEEVFELGRAALEQGKESPLGFILAPGCELPVRTPHENLRALVAAARVHGRYD